MFKSRLGYIVLGAAFGVTISEVTLLIFCLMLQSLVIVYFYGNSSPPYNDLLMSYDLFDFPRCRS
jgi:hypothetical protein